MKRIILILSLVIATIGNINGQVLINSYAFETSSFESEYQDVLDHAIAQGYTLPSAGVQSTDNDIIIALKGDGNWSKMVMFYKFATDGDSDYALIDWVDPTNTPSHSWVGGGGAGTFATTGLKGSGSSYLNLGWDGFPASYTLNDASWMFDIVTEQTTGSPLIYANTDNSGTTLGTRFFNAATFHTLNGSPTSTNRDYWSFAGTGFMTASRDSSIRTSVFIDGVGLVDENMPSLNLSGAVRLFVNGNTLYGNSELGMFAVGTNINGEENNVYEAIKNAPVN